MNTMGHRQLNSHNTCYGFRRDMSRLKDPCACCTHDRGPHASATAWGSRYRCNGMRQPGCRAPNQLARLALPSSPCPAWPRSEEGAPHCEQEEALRSRSPSPSSTAERRTKRRQNQAREGCVAQASCAETVCPPAAKTGAAQSEGRTVLSKPSARLVERARRERRAGLCGGTVPSATSVRAGGSLSPSVSHTVVAWRCLEDRTLTGAPHRV